MTNSYNNNFTMLENAYFTVDIIPNNSTHSKVTFVYKNAEKKFGENIMLVLFPPDEPWMEKPMQYDAKNKQYIVEIERPHNTSEMFLITNAKIPYEEKNQTAAVLERGYLSLKEGKQQPVNKNPTMPAGNLQTFLLTQDWQIKKVEHPDINALQEGERFIKIHTPPGYDPNRKPPYRLQITLDGEQYLNIMQMNVIYDNLINANEIEPVITVFISPHSGPPDELEGGYEPVMPKGYGIAMRLKEYCCNPEFANRIVSLPRTLNQIKFNVTNDPSQTTLWGMSAGGLAAEYIALLHPEVFGNVVAQSPMAWNIPLQNGENWREGIVETYLEVKDENNPEKKKKIDITWTTSTALLPEKEGEHKEYITDVLRKGYDDISKRPINPQKKITFYFDAGEKEREYHPKEGSANLVKSTELFAEVAKEKGHIVIGEKVHILPGGHHTMTWMRNIPTAARSIHSSKLNAELTDTLKVLNIPVTEIFIKGLQAATDRDPFPEKFWEDYSEKSNYTFQDALDKYAEYYRSIKDPEQQKQLSVLFWNLINKIKTPIIEELSSGEVKVHFLFPRDKYDYTTKKLYIFGDFHGFTSSDNDRQEMKHKANTDIMHRSNTMPRNSIVTYNFLQVPPEYQNKSRQELTGETLPKSFYNMEEIPELGNDPLTEFKSDEYAKHTDIGRSIFCANAENNLSEIKLFHDTEWNKLLAEDNQGNLKNLTHKGTYFCDMNNILREDKNPATDYMKKIWNVEDKVNTRSISVFQSGDGKVDNLIILHDGVSYMGTGSIERIDALIGEQKIPKNIAIICISQLPGLIEKYKKHSPQEFANATDPRPIEYGSRIDDYITFIEQALTQLGYEDVPAKNRTLIGSSMSGTASLFMILKHTDKFGHVIAQAPTEGTRIILRPLIQKRIEEKKRKEEDDLSSKIHLSCGKFETLKYAQNIRLAHTEELAVILGSNDQKLPVDDTGNYGHLPHCWSVELTVTLPKIYHKQQELNLQISKLDQPQKFNLSSDITTKPESSTVRLMKKGVASKEHAITNKMPTDDTTIQSNREKKRSQEFASTTEKKHASSIDDFDIHYSNQPGKNK